MCGILADGAAAFFVHGREGIFDASFQEPDGILDNAGWQEGLATFEADPNGQRWELVLLQIRGVRLEQGDVFAEAAESGRRLRGERQGGHDEPPA